MEPLATLGSVAFGTSTDVELAETIADLDRDIVVRRAAQKEHDRRAKGHLP